LVSVAGFVLGCAWLGRVYLVVRCGAVGRFPAGCWPWRRRRAPAGSAGPVGAWQSGVLAGDRLAFCRACGREMTPAWFLVR
jgi:hypothetical protein